MTAPVTLTLSETATHLDLNEAYSKAFLELTLKGSCVLDDPAIGSDLKARKFNENLYVITGFKLPDPGKSAVSTKLQELQRNPPPEMVQPGSYLPIFFQHGEISKTGSTGTTMEMLLLLCKDRLEALNTGAFECLENTQAIALLDQVIALLQTRSERCLREK